MAVLSPLRGGHPHSDLQAADVHDSRLCSAAQGEVEAHLSRQVVSLHWQAPTQDRNDPQVESTLDSSEEQLVVVHA